MIECTKRSRLNQARAGGGDDGEGDDEGGETGARIDEERLTEWQYLAQSNQGEGLVLDILLDAAEFEAAKSWMHLKEMNADYKKVIMVYVM